MYYIKKTKTHNKTEVQKKIYQIGYSDCGGGETMDFSSVFGNLFM